MPFSCRHGGLYDGFRAIADIEVDQCITTSAALALASAALKACADKGFAVSVAVVDRSGLVKVLSRGDDASPHTVDRARRKAFTSVSYRAPTTRLNEVCKTDGQAAGRPFVRDVSIIGGGLPKRADGKVVGAISVSGAPPAGEVNTDEVCAKVGIEAVRL